MHSLGKKLFSEKDEGFRFFDGLKNIA